MAESQGTANPLLPANSATPTDATPTSGATPANSHAPAESQLVVVHVHVHVKPDCVDQFKEATRINASHSLEEPGVARFDVVQQVDDPTRFVLVEAYRTAEAVDAHKTTAHYQTWREAVAPLMAEPRSSVKYMNVFPEASAW